MIGGTGVSHSGARSAGCGAGCSKISLRRLNSASIPRAVSESRGPRHESGAVRGVYCGSDNGGDAVREAAESHSPLYGANRRSLISSDAAGPPLASRDPRSQSPTAPHVPGVRREAATAASWQQSLQRPRASPNRNRNHQASPRSMPVGACDPTLECGLQVKNPRELRVPLRCQPRTIPFSDIVIPPAPRGPGNYWQGAARGRAGEHCFFVRRLHMEGRT